MGVQARIVLFAPSEDRARKAAAAAFARMVELEGVMSDYRSDSELSRLSDASGRGPVPVSDDLFDVLALSQNFAVLSHGAFDATLGPITILWREARRMSRPPDPERLRAARGLCGWKRMRLDSEARTVALQLEGMRLDLGGIGKGFACDAAAEVLRRRGLERCLIELGGDLVVLSPPPGENAWTVVARCGEDDARPIELQLEHAAVATSGDTEQYLEIDGRRYSHVVDPRTGRGVTHRSCVTVIASADATIGAAPGATADALASALSVLEESARDDLLARLPSCRAIIRGPNPPAQDAGAPDG